MKQAIHSFTRPILFRQWSRKAYAAFASLGKVVLIARVGKSITEASLCKVAGYPQPGDDRMSFFYGKEDTPEGPPDEGFLLLAQTTLLEKCIYSEPATCAVPGYSYPNELELADLPVPFSCMERANGKSAFFV